ncbi:hypothetical protein GGX14DRAFT_540216 [Mycena pura]|uniref:Uncharacterized protein n=1 Tax=Mycena pura TaxID=153505 RepID=A0AAD6YLX1_9AGAR|nr:hypothetical protein GGX14DRAFT_540216 [Mycena pura]
MSDVRTDDLERRRPQPDSDVERSFKRQKIDGEHWQLSEIQSLLHNSPASPSHHCPPAQNDSSSPPAPLSGAEEDTPAALEPQMRDDPGIEAEVLDPSVTGHDTVSLSSQPRSECAAVAYALRMYFSSYASGHPRETHSAGHGDDGVITSATLSDPAAPEDHGWTLLPVRVARRIQACTQQTGTRALETLLGFHNYGLDFDPETIDIQPCVIPASICPQALPVPENSPLAPEHPTSRSESPSPRARLELLQDLPSECETSGRALAGSTGNSISDSPTSEGPCSRPEEATVTECYDWESLKRAVERTQSMIDQLLRTAELEEAEVIRRVALPHLKGKYI